MIPMGKIIAQRLHEIVTNGELGYDYTLDLRREKNRRFRMQYCINDAMMKDILMELTEQHYVKSEQSANPEHLDDIIHVFKIAKDLVPRIDEEVNFVHVCIYIKVIWPSGEEPMFIISFHEDEE